MDSDSLHGTRSVPPDADRPVRSGAGVSLGKAGAAVTVATALANLLAYLVPMLAARRLDADGLGAVATVMAVLAIAGVPGMGLQLVVAMAVARHGSVHRLGRLAAIAATATAAPLLLLTPFLAELLRLPWQALALTAAMAAAVVAGSAWLGVAQGAQRFGLLAVGLAALGVARCGGVILGLLLGGDLIELLLLGVAVAVVAAGGVRWLTGVAVPETGGVRVPGLARDVWAAGSATLGLFVLTYADLIAARHLLAPAASAQYAVLNVLTKGAIWAPQVITIVAVPSLARGVARAKWLATIGVLAVGVVLVGATVAFGPFALRLVGGSSYTGLAAYAPAFAAVGALYALVFVLTNAQVAGGARMPAAPTWLATAGFCVAVLSLERPTVGGIVTCAIVAASLTVVALLLLGRSAPTSPSVHDPGSNP